MAQQKEDTRARNNKRNGQSTPDRKGDQPKKNNRQKRVNFDNTRDSKFEADIQEERHSRKGYDKPMKKSGTFSKGACNDVSWYAANAELLKASASYPFSDVVGMQLNDLSDNVFPGVMALEWSPVIDGDAVNQSANSHYSFTVHANSRNYSYDAPDQMMMILAGANVFSAIAAGIRAYGTMRKFNGLNYYTPEALVTAMGFNYSDLKTNLSQAWFDLNEIIARSAQIWIPKDMPIIERWFWMNSNIYTDSQSSKAQFYLYKQIQFYKLSETGSSTGTSLIALNFPASSTSQPGCTWSQYVAFVNSLIDALLASQDRGIIFGDLLAAFGADRIYGISSIASNYEVNFSYEPEVLWQIENSVQTNAIPDAVTQIDGRITSSWQGSEQSVKLYGLNKPILNFHQTTAPTPEQIMVATRMMALGYQVVTTSTGTPAEYSYKPVVCGTELCLNIRVWKYVRNSSTGVLNLSGGTLTQVQPGSTYTATTVMAWASFDWAPILYTVDSGTKKSDMVPTTKGSISEYYPNAILADVDMYSTIDWTVVKKMHTTATYSLYGVSTLI